MVSLGAAVVATGCSQPTCHAENGRRDAAAARHLGVYIYLTCLVCQLDFGHSFGKALVDMRCATHQGTSAGLITAISHQQVIC